MLHLLLSSRAVSRRLKHSPGRSPRGCNARNNHKNATFVSNSTNNANSRRTTNGIRTNRTRTISGRTSTVQTQSTMATQTGSPLYFQAISCC
jgi:hypothetical protein